MPQVAEALIAVVLIASMGRAYFGPPPDRADPLAAAGWMVAGLLLLGTVVLTRDHAVWRLLLTGLAVESVCVAGWWLRGTGDDDGGDGGSPVDWDEFDRLRGGWDRPRPRDPVAG